VNEHFKLAPPDTVEFAWSIISKTFPGYEIPCRGDQAIIRVKSEGGMFPHQVTILGETKILNGISDHVEFSLPATTATPHAAVFKDNLDCPAPNQLIALTQPPSHVAVSVGAIVPPVCINGDDGQINLSAGGGIQFPSPNQYKFVIKRFDAVTFDTDTLLGTAVTFLRPASYFTSLDYDVRVIDKHGCTNNNSLTMPPNPDPLTLTADAQVSPSCYGGNDGYITVSATDYGLIGGTSLRFKLSGGHLGSTVISALVNGATHTFTNLEGTDINGNSAYKAWVEDVNACPDTAYQYLDNLLLPSFTPVTVSLLKAIRPSCFNGTDGSLFVHIAGGVPPYRYSLDNINFTNVAADGNIFINNLTAGTYTFYVTDANFKPSQPTCLTATPFVVQPGRFIRLLTDITPVSCVGSADGAINLSPLVDNINTADGESFVASRLSLQWVFDNTATPIATTEDINALAAGRYTVHARYDVDSLVCTNQASATILQPGNGAFRISGIVTYNASCGALVNDGSAVVTVAGGWPNAPSFYKLDPAGTWKEFHGSFLVTDLAPGTHAVQISQAASCSHSQSFIITASQLPLVTDRVIKPACPLNADGSVILSSAASNVIFARIGGAFQASGVFGGLPKGDYRFVAIKNGMPTCKSDTLDVSVEDPIDCGTGVLSLQLVTSQRATCAAAMDGQARVMATGGVPPYRFFWDGSAVPAASAANNLEAGSHTVIVKDTVGASASLTVFIDALDPIVLQAFSSMASCPTACDGDAQVLITGGSTFYSMAWADGDLSGTDRQNMCAGNYNFTVADNLNNNCTISGQVHIEHYPQLNIELAAMMPPVCPGGTDGYIATDVSGGSGNYSIAWSNGAAGKRLQGYGPGEYTISVADNLLGCAANKTFNLPDALPITLASTIITPPRCYGGSDGQLQLILENVASPLVLWSNGQVGLVNQNLKAGTYAYSITGSSGCTTSGTVLLTERPPLAVTSSATMPLCFGACNGAAAISITGGVAPFSIRWAHGPRSASLLNLCAGVYNYTVSDKFNCEVTGTVTITAPPPLVINKKSHVTPDCYASSNGSITVEASGGTGTYKYQWGANILSPSINGLPAGDYTVAVSDDNLCAVTKTFSLPGPAALLLLQDKITNPSCHQAADGQIMPNPVGGTAPYSFAWENQASVQARSRLVAGTYSLTITDSKGCSISKNYTLQAPTALELVNAMLTDPVCFDDKNGSISVQAVGGVGPYAFAWTNGNSANAILKIGAGNYSVTVTDKNGCSVEAAYTLNNPDKLTIQGIAEKITICTGSPTTVEPQGAWSAYWWTGPQKFTATSRRIQTSIPGTYSLLATDLEGCPATTNFSIEASKDALVADFLRISEAIAFQPVVFVDISLPEPGMLEWIIPDDRDVVINSRTNASVEIVFTRTGTFEIGIRASMGTCKSELYKAVLVAEPKPQEAEGGRVALEERTVKATVYPNPGDEQLSVLIEVPSRNAVNIWLISAVENREFFHKNLEGQYDYMVQWDISKLTPGVYYLIYRQDKITHSEKVSIIR
jgi:hypothetical protein